MTDERKPSRAELGESAFVGHGGRTPRALVHGGHSARHLCLDGRYLYWTDRDTGELSRIPTDGGVPMVLAQATRPAYVTVVEGHLYWVQHAPPDPGHWHQEATGAVARMPVGGGAVELVASRLESPNEVAVSGAEVAISCDGRFDDDRREEVHGMIVRTTLGGAKARVVATKQRRPESLAFVDDDLYWLNNGWKWPDYFADGALMRMKRDGGTKRWVVRKDQPMASSLLVDEGHLYWTTSSVHSRPGQPGGIHKRPRAGGPTVALVSWFESEGALLAQDRTHLYWLSHGWGTMYRVAKTGGTPEKMMSCDERIVICDGLAVDERRVYWVVNGAPEAGGAVWSMAKEPAGVRAPDASAAPLPN